MNNIIDLHGLTESEALPQIILAIMEVENDMAFSVEIITGNGYVLKDILIDELNKTDLNYYHPNGNSGSFIIEK